MERGSFGRVIVGAVVSAAVLSGCSVTSGVKYALRTDVMYRR